MSWLCANSKFRRCDSAGIDLNPRTRHFPIRYTWDHPRGWHQVAARHFDRRVAPASLPPVEILSWKTHGEHPKVDNISIETRDTKAMSIEYVHVRVHVRVCMCSENNAGIPF